MYKRMNILLQSMLIVRSNRFAAVIKTQNSKISMSSSHQSCSPSDFKFKNALLVSKLSRFEFEQQKNPNLSTNELEKMLRARGTDYQALVDFHKYQKEYEESVVKSFQHYGKKVKIANRMTLSTKLTDWADIVVPIGGDGTFLLTANRASPLFSKPKPIIGFNSDPLRSEGRLMLPKCFSRNPKNAVKRLIDGNFKWLKRSRIRITMLGNNGNLPESYDLQELNPKPMELNEYPTELLNADDQKLYQAKVKRILPYLALNEVFIGETLSARVSHLHLKIDNQNIVNKTKCSGLCVSTGTGSSSWLTSINRLSPQNVQKLLDLINEKQAINVINAENIANRYNSDIIYPPDDLRLCYSVREQVCVSVWPKPKEFEAKGYARTVQIMSRCIEASLVIDGGIAYPFNDGAKVLLEVHPEDSLITVSMNET